MTQKVRVSALTRMSEETLLKAMDLPDIREMAYLSQDVVEGRKSVCEFRKREAEMITKYGFQTKSQFPTYICKCFLCETDFEVQGMSKKPRLNTEVTCTHCQNVQIRNLAWDKVKASC